MERSEAVQAAFRKARCIAVEGDLRVLMTGFRNAAAKLAAYAEQMEEQLEIADKAKLAATNEMLAVRGEFEQLERSLAYARTSHGRLCRGIKQLLGLKNWPTFPPNSVFTVQVLTLLRQHFERQTSTTKEQPMEVDQGGCPVPDKTMPAIMREMTALNTIMQRERELLSMVKCRERAAMLEVKVDWLYQCIDKAFAILDQLPVLGDSSDDSLREKIEAVDAGIQTARAVLQVPPPRDLHHE